MRRRKTVYPPAKTATRGPAAEARTLAASRVVSIDPSAIRGKLGLEPGLRVEVIAGRYVGEAGVVETIAGGVIPAVVVRTAAGLSRRIRAVDLAPQRAPSEQAKADPA